MLAEFAHPISSITVGPQDRVAIAGFQLRYVSTTSVAANLTARWRVPARILARCAFSSDLRRLAAGGRNGIVRVWNLEADESFDIKAHEHRLRAILFGQGDTVLLTAGDAAEIGVWNLSSRRLRTVFPIRPARCFR